MLSIIPVNSLFAGDGIVCCATRWLTVAVALRRPNGSIVGALHMMCSRERGSPPVSHAMSLASENMRWRKSSLDGWGPRETPSWRSSLS